MCDIRSGMKGKNKILNIVSAILIKIKILLITCQRKNKLLLDGTIFGKRNKLSKRSLFLKIFKR